MGKWSENEIKFLINNYSDCGVYECSKVLNRSKLAILSKASELNLKKKNVLDKNINDVTFIRNNYNSYGGQFCADNLNKPLKYVNRIAFSLKLRVKPEIRKINQKNIIKLKNINKYDVDDFINIRFKEIAYFLGYFWADGHIGQYSSKTSSISLVENDAEFLYKKLSQVNKSWNLSNSIKKYWTTSNNEKKIVSNQKKISTNSIEIYEFLKNNDYNNKSYTSFNLIWNKIPDEYKNYFILGFFDGDGSFLLNVKNKYVYGRVVFVSTYECDWSCLELFLTNNNIKYKKYKSIVKLGKSSRLVISKQESIILFYKLIYFDNALNGLDRKRIKYEQFINLKHEKK